MENLASLTKTCRSGQKRTLVPVMRFATRLTLVRPERLVNCVSGPGPEKTPGVPRLNDTDQVAPSRSTSTSSRDDSALTTDAPTPCSPPDAAYEPPPNFPPACSLVMTTSTPDRPVFSSLSTGMPRPSSRASAQPS